MMKDEPLIYGNGDEMGFLGRDLEPNQPQTLCLPPFKGMLKAGLEFGRVVGQLLAFDDNGFEGVVGVAG
jgi:hypothetical protein